MRIAVYDVAAKSGGALSVLMEYYSNAVADKENQYLFVVGLANLEETANVRVLRVPYVKRSWLHRLAYDIFIAHRVMKSFRVEKIISLQNIIIPFCSIYQCVYMHNLLPTAICDVSFSLWKSPKLWIYQNIIGRLIIDSCKKADSVVVQAEWIKNRLVSRCGISPDKIVVERPAASTITILPRYEHSDVVTFFYPASGEPFKNHKVIVRACELLNNQGMGGYRILFTLDGSESKEIVQLHRKAIEYELPIVFLGWLDHRQMAEMYAISDCLLFSSQVETFGLPLYEAMKAGLDIIASDLAYAHETIGSYASAVFFEPTNPDCLCKLIAKEVLKNAK